MDELYEAAKRRDEARKQLESSLQVPIFELRGSMQELCATLKRLSQEYGNVTMLELAEKLRRS